MLPLFGSLQLWVYELPGPHSLSRMCGLEKGGKGAPGGDSSARLMDYRMITLSVSTRWKKVIFELPPSPHFFSVHMLSKRQERKEAVCKEKQ